MISEIHSGDRLTAGVDEQIGRIVRGLSPPWLLDFMDAVRSWREVLKDVVAVDVRRSGLIDTAVRVGIQLNGPISKRRLHGGRIHNDIESAGIVVPAKAI